MMTFPVTMQCSVDVVLEASICLYVICVSTLKNQMMTLGYAHLSLVLGSSWHD